MLEDDSDDRYITEQFFRERGYDIGLQFLLNSDDVLPFLRRCELDGLRLPSLILLDKNAPAGGGVEVLRALKTDPLLRAIPVVMLSGSVQQKEVMECYQLGVNSFIAKPFTNEATAEAIETFVRYWFSTSLLPEYALAYS
jgi:two-component system response regulator